jgi:DNA-binding NarL/FixJ family response regulator
MKNRASNKARKRILIADDHPITRYGLAQLIGREPDLAVCGEAEGAQQALAAVKPTKPDLVLADITMPGRSGLEFIKDMQVLHPNVPVLVMSMHDETIYAERALRAGARGYIMKSEGGEKLLEAIRQVLRGQVSVSKGMATAILDVFARRRSSVADTRLAVLTDREFEVFQAIGQGLSSRAISKRFGISPKTVGTHRIHIKEKLKLNTGAELVQYAVRWVATQQLI